MKRDTSNLDAYAETVSPGDTLVVVLRDPAPREDQAAITEYFRRLIPVSATVIVVGGADALVARPGDTLVVEAEVPPDKVEEVVARAKEAVSQGVEVLVAPEGVFSLAVGEVEG